MRDSDRQGPSCKSESTQTAGCGRPQCNARLGSTGPGPPPPRIRPREWRPGAGFPNRPLKLCVPYDSDIEGRLRPLLFGLDSPGLSCRLSIASRVRIFSWSCTVLASPGPEAAPRPAVRQLLCRRLSAPGRGRAGRRGRSAVRGRTARLLPGCGLHGRVGHPVARRALRLSQALHCPWSLVSTAGPGPQARGRP